MWGPNKLRARASCSDLNGDYKARAKLVRDGAVDKYSVWFTKLNTTYSTDWHYCVSGCPRCVRGLTRLVVAVVLNPCGFFPATDSSCLQADHSVPTIELDEVSVQYPNAAPLRDLSVTFRSGSVGILGPSGSGKSTLLRVIAGLQKPTVGAVRIDEQPVAMPSWRSASDRRVAMIHQDYRLVPFLTVRKICCLLPKRAVESAMSWT